MRRVYIWLGVVWAVRRWREGDRYRGEGRGYITEIYNGGGRWSKGCHKVSGAACDYRVSRYGLPFSCGGPAVRERPVSLSLLSGFCADFFLFSMFV